MTLVGEIDKDIGFILSVADFNGLAHCNRGGESFAFSIKMVDDLKKGVSNLLFEI